MRTVLISLLSHSENQALRLAFQKTPNLTHLNMPVSSNDSLKIGKIQFQKIEIADFRRYRRSYKL